MNLLDDDDYLRTMMNVNAMVFYIACLFGLFNTVYFNTDVLLNEISLFWFIGWGFLIIRDKKL